MLPDPVYATEQIRGVLWELDDTCGVSLAPATAPACAAIITQGDLVIRYGIEVQRTPDAILPGIFIAESGAIKTGRDAWEWLWNKFQLYPRAEVIGVTSGGQPAHLYVRDLDFGYPPRVVVYDAADDGIPLASITQMITSGDAPELLARYLG